MRRMQLLDASFLQLESRQTPMHVAPLALFTLPKGVNEQRFMAHIMEVLRSTTEFRKPFGERAVTGKAGPLGPLYWEEDGEIDLEYHVRHSALPQPGRYRELFSLVSRLHGKLLDRNRPPWEIHLIEGLQNRQFALYMKLHHAAVDGVSALQIVESMCSTNEKTRIEHGPLSLEVYEQYKQAKYGDTPRQVKPSERELKTVADMIKNQLDTSSNVYGLLKNYAKTWLGRGEGVAVPFHHVPRTSINTNVSGSRRYVAQSWDMDRVKTVGKAVGGTINDVVLAMCAGGLRRYLLSRNELPRHSLRAMVPVSLRAPGDTQSANVVNFITANLATRQKDPEKRMSAIIKSMRQGKEMISGMTAKEASVYAQVAQVSGLLTAILGLAEQFPAFSVGISNVPGPRHQLYWNGAAMDGLYPVSAIYHGIALNITLVGYNNHLDFGLTACRRALPQVQRIIDHMEDSLVELEETIK